MVAHECKLCKKVFKLKTDYERHINKKTACVKEEIIVELHKDIFKEEKNNTEDINKIKKFLNFCHDTLRDKDGIVGMKALSNISMLLFLKFINNSVKYGYIDLLNIEKYRIEQGTCDDKFKKNKKYIKYCQFDNIIQDGKFKVEIFEIPIIIEFIFKHVLWYHPSTKNIFLDEFPSIKNESSYEQIFKRLDKLDWDMMDVDIKGIAYEYFLKSEMDSGGDLGQFFTKREVVEYMINVIKPSITKNSTIIDPFMGTGGFLTHIYNEIKNKYIKENIPFTQEQKLKLINGIEKNPQTCMLALNNFLVSMDIFPTGVKCDDSIRNYITEKYDIVLTNPPFGIKGLTYDDETMFSKIKNKIKKEDYLPYKTNDAICMALQFIQYILKENGICAIVVPDGKQLTSTKEKAIINTRKMLIENNNLFQVTKLPSGTFLPYTGVETMILFFRKGEKTKNIKFVKLENDYKTEKIIGNIDVKLITKQNYSLNYKLYTEDEKLKYDNIQYKKLYECVTEYTRKKITDMNKIYYTCQIKQQFQGIKLIDKKKYDEVKNLFVVEEDNLLISKLGANKGGICIITKQDLNCVISNDYLQYTINKSINKDYLMYCFRSSNFIDKIIDNVNGAIKGRQRIKNDDLLNIQIPIPPLPIQQLIVKELDSMYKEKEYIQNSINERSNSRKVKFELLVNKCKDKKNMILKDICEILNRGKEPTDELNDKKKYPYYGTGGITGYTNEWIVDGDYILTPGDGTIGRMILCKDKSFPSHHMNIIKPKPEFNIKFIYHSLISNNLDSLKTGSTIPNITKSILENMKILIPSLSDQQLIVSEMEKYDILEQLQKEHILELDNIIKQRFDYHLSKCKKEIDTKKQNDSESEELEDEKPKKVKKKE